MKTGSAGEKMDRILVIGGGSWGTSFANYLATQGNKVKLWIREPEVIESINKFRENSLFLPEIILSENLYPVSGLEKEVAESDIIIFAVPSKFIRQTFKSLGEKLSGKTLISLSKGFESTSLKTISRIASDVLGKKILKNWITISGPSFAKELANNFPTAVVAASENGDNLKHIQEKFSSSVLRIYRSDDLIGIEVAGSMKNIMAIASGIIGGLGYGYNTTASLVTRSSMEILRIGLKLGAQRETFWGLAGIGDLMLTSFGPLSRNYQLGVRIAKGEKLKDIEEKSITIAEGVETTKAIRSLSKQLNIEMPISTKVYEILFENKDPATALKELMKRSLKIEWNID